MDVLEWLIPDSLLLGGIGLTACVWRLGRGQFDDPKDDAHRVLSTDRDDRPGP